MLKKLRFLISLLLTITILIIIFARINFGDIKTAFDNSDHLLILLASLALFTTAVIGALRWQTILKLLGSNNNFKDTLVIYLANIPVSKVTPANSGDLVRAFYLKGDVAISKNIGGIFAERMFDITVLSILSIIGGLIFNIKMAVVISVIIILAIFVFFILGPKINIFFNENWRHRINNFFYFSRILVKHPASLIVIALYTLALWFIVLLFIKIVFIAFGATVPFLTIVAVQPLAIFFGLLPFTISGIGAREPAMIYLYSGLAPASVIFMVGLTYSTVGILLLSLLCLPFLFRTIKNKH
jgi:hypothetical protein